MLNLSIKLLLKFNDLTVDVFYLLYYFIFVKGEVAEWFKAPAWKACVWQHTEGSNPFLSAIDEINNYKKKSEAYLVIIYFIYRIIRKREPGPRGLAL